MNNQMMSKPINDKALLKQILENEDIIVIINNHISGIKRLIPEVNIILEYDKVNNTNYWEQTLYSLGSAPTSYEIRLSILYINIINVMLLKSYQCYTDINEVYKNTIKQLLNKDVIYRKFIDEIYYLVGNYGKPITQEEVKINPDLASKRYLIEYYATAIKSKDKIQSLKRIKDLFKE